jgi:glycosyltransferase involved in cell wall biosynthesis
MQVLIAVEQHFERGPDQRIYADGPSKYSGWANYLEAFDSVVVLARVSATTRPGREEARADGPSVSFCELPDYHGPWQYLCHLPQLKRRVREAIEACDAYVLRVPGLIGRLVWLELERMGKAYALEVVGDPWDALGPGTWRSAFRPAFRSVATKGLQAMCQRAMAIHYVTQTSLQRRYPPGAGTYAVGFSDALMDSAFAPPAVIEERCRRINGTAGAAGSATPFRLGFIGSFSQLYKGPEVLLRAASLCRARGLDVETMMAGDGRYSAAMKALATRLGIEDRTRLVGQLPFGKSVFDFLDSVDLFVMPSYAEGLPRALLEAMARGCPCLGSNVGGIPELLPPADLVPPGDPKAWADRIMEVAGNPQRLKQMAQRNLEKAREFSPDLLKQVRRDFCQYVRDHSESNRRA